MREIKYSPSSVCYGLALFSQVVQNGMYQAAWSKASIVNVSFYLLTGAII